MVGLELKKSLHGSSIKIKDRDKLLMQFYTPGFLPSWIWKRQHSQELKSVQGSAFCHHKYHKEQMQVESHLSVAAAVLLLRNYMLRREYFLLICPFHSQHPTSPPSPAHESELAADTLAVLFSRAESCNHLDSVACSIYPSIQDYCHTISVVLEIVQFIKHIHNK